MTCPGTFCTAEEEYECGILSEIVLCNINTDNCNFILVNFVQIKHVDMSLLATETLCKQV